MSRDLLIKYAIAAMIIANMKFSYFHLCPNSISNPVNLSSSINDSDNLLSS